MSLVLLSLFPPTFLINKYDLYSWRLVRFYSADFIIGQHFYQEMQKGEALSVSVNGERSYSYTAKQVSGN